MRLVITLQTDETGMVVAECPAIPGCVSQGRTEEEAVANIREAINGCLAARAANGLPLTVTVREVEVECHDCRSSPASEPYVRSRRQAGARTARTAAT
jgi:predicted RNase H-like HicB family nuclease